MPVAKVQLSSRAAGTANWEFVCNIDLELDFQNGKECFMTVKQKSVSSYEAVSTTGRMKRDDFMCGGEELD